MSIPDNGCWLEQHGTSLKLDGTSDSLPTTPKMFRGDMLHVCIVGNDVYVGGKYAGTIPDELVGEERDVAAYEIARRSF